MRSSTSSSSARGIAAALGVFVALTAIYGRVVERWFPGGAPAAYQQHANVITVEKLVHGGEQPSCIVVGSSMGAVLPAAALPAGSYNLSLSSLGAQAGLAILLRAPARPRVVLVEADVTALIPPSEELVASVFEPVTFALRRWLPVARHDRQPMALVDETLRRWTARGKKESDYVMPPALYQQRLDQLVAQQTAWQLPASAAASVDRLAAQVRALEDGGARVVFFEPPMDARLRDTAESAGVRALLRARFAPDRYPWIAPADWSAYQTSDGLHLVPRSADRLARLLGDELLRAR